MSTRSMLRNTAVLAITMVVSACAGYEPPPYPVPDDPGLYAVVSDDELQRLDGDKEWEVETWQERANLSPQVEFVLMDPVMTGNVRPRADMVEIWKVAWVRSEIGRDDLAAPIEGSAWTVAEIEPFQIPFVIDSPRGMPDVVHFVPKQPLEPGLYAIRLNGSSVAREARLGVGWNSINRRQYSAENCVDRFTGNQQGYQLCRGGSQGAQMQPAARTSRDLEIVLADPVRTAGGLLIQGVVINKSNDVQQVPPMEATLRDSSGFEVRRWVVEPELSQLGPGRRTSFATQIEPVPTNVKKVNVTFASDTVM